MKKAFRWLFTSALIGAASAANAESFDPVAIGAEGLVAPGVALFLPQGLERMGPSLALLAPPHIEKTLPAGWALRPRFSRSALRTRLEVAVPPGTSLYGTGEVKGGLLRNGTSIRLWNTDTPEYTVDGGRRLYQSHPWVLGVRPDGTAFGVLADTTWAADLSLPGAVVLTSDGPLFPVIVIEGSGPAQVVRSLASLTGRMPMPPRWALGYQQCRWSYFPAARVREVAEEFRKRGIPCDVLWMDIDYMDAFKVFTFDRKGFGDPVGLNAYLHQLGFKTVYMIDPGVKAQPGYPVYDSGSAADVWVHDASGKPLVGSVWPGPCVFPDFTRPETRFWWAANYRAFMATGIDGVWNDMNEPSVFNGPGKTMPLDAVHRAGGDLLAGTHAQYHNVYGMLMVRATREGVLQANPDKRPFVLSRSNYIGGQRYAATWTGDNGSTEEFMDEAIPMSLNLGLSGQPFNGPDLGGFGENASADLWRRWIAFGAYFPFCRGHACKGTNDKEPWAFGREVENTARIALQRRYRLMPYLYGLFHRSAEDGSPIMEPLFFADPADPRLRSEDRAFLLGDDLLVVPAGSKAALPRGFSRETSLVEGDTRDSYQASLRVRDGAIIPVGVPVQSTEADSLGTLLLKVSLNSSGTAQGDLYEDAGEGYGYQKGEYLVTHYSATRSGDTVTVAVASTEGRRPRPARPLRVDLLTDHGVLSGEGIDGHPVTISLK
jgi:alpha-glucosidase